MEQPTSSSGLLPKSKKNRRPEPQPDFLALFNRLARCPPEHNPQVAIEAICQLNTLTTFEPPDVVFIS